MAGTGTKLINKISRRSKSIKEAAKHPDQFDKTFLSPATMQDSPRVYELLRKAVRRINRAFGNFPTGQEPVLHAEYVATSLGRVSIGGGLFATQLTMTATEMGYTGAGLQPGDYVQVVQQNSPAAGQYLKVLSLTSTTQARLTDFPAFATAAVKQIDTVTTTADVSGSLNSTDWYINSEGNVTQYYVWYNVNGAGVDPAVGGKTGIPVALATNAPAATVATATKAALDGVGGTPWVTTIGPSNKLTITWSTAGAVTPATNGAAPTTFTFAQTQAGANANPTPTAETNVTVRLEINEPKSYT
jgi:hypothetical protein